ncbi:zona pellucida sperm-binding protein 3d.2 [Brachyhypopomus gauderio]|uniref:zona pellucida sperm-binding protein 3d.2 n=1 Tax=Brachyhypopomus gauderio TaxID=698409 RepID=UPI004042A84E
MSEPSRSSILPEHEQNQKYFQSPYLHLPMFQHSRVPLLNKDQFSPAGGPGLKHLPERVKDVLLPERSRSPTTGAARAVCSSKEMRVHVPTFTLGSGVSHYDVKLGTCNISRSTRHHIIFVFDMGQCGTKIEIINNRVVFSNMLRYTLVATSGSVRSVFVPIQCHFNRFYYSYKIGFLPHVESQRLFKPMKFKSSVTLTPCDAQWNKLPPSEAYTIGHPMYFEAKVPSVAEGERLFVHNCHVTMNISPFSKPQVIIIDNYGCITNSKNSRSRFMESNKKNVLRFSVDAFVFWSSPVTVITSWQRRHLYIHCETYVKRDIPTATSKFCTYNPNKHRWEELYGFNSVCSCCTSTCVSGAPPAFNKIITSKSWSMIGEDRARVRDSGRVTWESHRTAGEQRPMMESRLVFEEVFGLN